MIDQKKIIKYFRYFTCCFFVFACDHRLKPKQVNI